MEPFTSSFFSRLQQLKIHTRRAFLGSRQGTHRSTRKGHGLEFSDYRQYAAGDDFRYIDWGVYGRTDRLYVREFREEQDLNVIVLLDGSASMNYPDGEGKFSFSTNLCLALGYIALTDGDTVTFSILGQQSSPRFIGARAFNRARAFLNQGVPKGNFDLLTEVRAAVDRQKIPGKCFFVSDFLIPTIQQVETLDYLRTRNFEIAVLQVLGPSELKLGTLRDEIIVDSETGEEVELELDGNSAQEYALSLSRHIEALEEYCLRSNIVHLLLSSDEDLNSVVFTRFPRAGILK